VNYFFNEGKTGGQEEALGVDEGRIEDIHGLFNPVKKALLKECLLGGSCRKQPGGHHGGEGQVQESKNSRGGERLIRLVIWLRRRLGKPVG